MAFFKASSVRELKDRISIVEVVSRVAAVKKAGSRFKALCPFHQEKSPSFHLNAEEGLYKCFGCGKSGDVISFVMETERLNFSEAVEQLAARFNIALEYEENSSRPEERSQRQELLELHDQVAEAYREAFLASNQTGEFIRAYWTAQRRFSLEVAEDFKIGLAPPDGAALADRLLRKNFSPESLRLSGLFFANEGATRAAQFRPRFRGRLMIPIRDHQGRVVAFTARQLEITPQDDPSREAKYVNSPETPIFVKSRVLFNLDRARMHAKPEVPFLMVEGQLDAIRCWTAGLQTTVAPQGTAVTEEQLSMLRRYEPRLECLLDGDSAGQKAALRLLPIALKAGLEVRFLSLPPGADPDSLLREGGIEALAALRTRAEPAADFACRSLLPDAGAASPADKALASRELFEIFSHADSAVAREEYLAAVAKRLEVSPAALQEDYRRHSSARAARAKPAPEVPAEKVAAPSGRSSTAEETLLLLCLHYQDLGPALSGAVSHEWISTLTLEGQLLDRFLADFEHGAWPGSSSVLDDTENPAESALIASLLFEKPSIDDPVRLANQAIRKLLSKYVDARLRGIELEIAQKQEKFDDETACLLSKASELRRLKQNPPTIDLQ
jgi:DNA primase